MDIGKVSLTQYPETGRGLTNRPVGPVKLQQSAEKMYHALKVVITDPKIIAFLQTNDNQAFSQAKAAVQLYEDNLFHL